ncbi:MAG: protoheme IX farnesyltransferase [Candidatus Marinamargulisbacteria bacterium]|jgi:protoheme IX farnesyltransferase
MKKRNPYVELVKPGILIHSLATVSIAFLLSRGTMAFAGPLFSAAFFGTGLVSAGAAALNHLVERDIDARMDRTKNRPLPSERLSPAAVQVFSMGTIVFGLLILFLAVNVLTAMLAMFTVFLYIYVYTPLKKRTWLNTFVGAVPGAIPALCGWAAATGTLSLEAWVFFLILFVWQIPHFFAIDWMYREDYRKGGLKMLSGTDPSGGRTASYTLSSIVILIFVSTVPFYIGMLGVTYFFGAIVLGLMFARKGAVFLMSKSVVDARKVLYLSLIYLPVLMSLMAFDFFLG